jgi:HD-GYP domain-containing protein (c-di-GMP phosphodiesterase class II)
MRHHRAVDIGRTPDQAPRLVEVVAAVSLATDLGLGQPMEHGLRSCMIATRVGDVLDLAPDDRQCIFWVALLAMAGCTADSHELAEVFGDDIETRRGLFDLGPSPMAAPRYFMAHAGGDGGALQRTRARAGLITSAMRGITDAYISDCRITGRFAERLGLGEGVSRPLEQKFERWDGKGLPDKLAKEQIALPARVLNLAWRIESQHREGGVDAARAILESHAGATLDPNLVGAVVPALPAILEGLEEETWDAVIAAEPARARLSGDELKAALEAIGDFADLKSPWFTGHSRALAELAEAAAWRMNLTEPEVTLVRHAALVHAIGRSGVANTVWDKRGTLSVAERERMQLHPYFTDRILRRGSLGALAEVASATQERLDGSGYPRGLSGTGLGTPARLLAAADVYQALREPRPHRPAISDDDAASLLRYEVEEGRMDAAAVEAVLTAAGHAPTRTRSAGPANLTAREVEVLALIARGLTSADVARELVISKRTVNSHIEHIYTKIGANNRSSATLFAMENGVV